MAVLLDEEKMKNILRQVEFYFSDSNFPRDKFLRSTVEQSEDGLVSLALICSFARMRSHLGLGSVKANDIPEETVLAVAEVLRKSSSLKVSEDGKKIGRSTVLLKPEEVIEQIDSRTVAASPFPYNVKIEDVQIFFGQKGKVNSVRLPRHIGDSRVFCGIALIEFSEEDEAKNILQEKLVYEGVDLELKLKNAFDAERLEKKEEFKRNRSNMDSSTGRNDFITEEAKGSHDSSTESYPKGLIIAFKLIPMPVMASEKQNDSEILKDEEVNNAEVSKFCETAKTTEDIEIDVKPSENVGEEGKGNAQGNDIENVEKAVSEEKSLEDVGEAGKRCTQRNGIESEENAATDSSKKIESKAENDLPTDVGDNAEGSANDGVVTREDLKKVFQKFGNVMYIDYSMGQESGYIRFDDPDAAVKARAVSVLNKEGGLVVKKKFIATLDPVTGEAEKDYWSLLRRANKDRHRENWGHRGRGRHNRGGRHSDGKRSRDFHAAKGRPGKAPKLADG